MSANPITTSDAQSQKEQVGFYPWFVIGVMIFALTISFIDRQIISLLVEPIKDDLQITDTQMSMLQGLAFALFYTLLGIPIATIVGGKLVYGKL